MDQWYSGIRAFGSAKSNARERDELRLRAMKSTKDGKYDQEMTRVLEERVARGLKMREMYDDSAEKIGASLLAAHCGDRAGGV